MAALAIIQPLNTSSYPIDIQRLKPKKMPEEPGPARNKFRSDFIVEIALIVAVAVYMVMAQGQVVGENLSFTVAGAALMALATYWTLHTIRDGLEVIALRLRPGK